MLVASILVAPWEAALIRPGMTRAQVEEILGSEGYIDPADRTFLDIFPRPGETQEEWAKHYRDARRRYWSERCSYETGGGVVIVSYHAPEDEPRVFRVESRRQVTWRFAWYLLQWTFVGGVLGLAAAEITRRRRPAASPAPAA